MRSTTKRKVKAQTTEVQKRTPKRTRRSYKPEEYRILKADWLNQSDEGNFYHLDNRKVLLAVGDQVIFIDKRLTSTVRFGVGVVNKFCRTCVKISTTNNRVIQRDYIDVVKAEHHWAKQFSKGAKANDK